MNKPIQVVLFDYHDHQIEFIQMTIADTKDIELLAIFARFC